MCVDGMFGVWIRAVCLCDVGVFAHVHSVTSRSVCVCSVSTPVCVCGYLWLDNEGLEGAGGKTLIYFSSYLPAEFALSKFLSVSPRSLTSQCISNHLLEVSTCLLFVYMDSI